MGWAAAAVAATDRDNLLAAALALPGLVSGVADAGSAPDVGFIELRYLDYRDWQPGASRMRVRNPGLYVSRALSDTLAFEGTLVYDAMSGASPLYFNTLSGASGLGVTDDRTAGDAKLTKYFDRYAVGVGAAVSSERDYYSQAVAIDLAVDSDDRNRTYALRVAATSDRINPTNHVVENAHRRTLDVLAGITQALSTHSIVQSNVTYSDGHGYYADPYKPADTRPDARRILAWLTRYNLYLPEPDATLQLTYRLLRDSFGSVSNAVSVAWVQALPHGYAVTPNVRYYTQSAAGFYFNPPFPQGYVAGQNYTADTRLAAFGAITVGLAASAALTDGWGINVAFDFYRQRPDWRLGGSGSPGIEDFSARWLQVGLSKTF
jgi:hypothetical protein